MTAPQLLNLANTGETEPQNLSIELRSLWLQQAGDWDAAHRLCHKIPDPAGAWIQAYLHRVEGDLSNAQHWYQRAGKQMPDYTLQKEWLEIVTELS